MKVADVKKFISQKRSERWHLFWKIKAELFKPTINAEKLILLSREWARISAELVEAKKLLRPNPFMQWVRKLK